MFGIDLTLEKMIPLYSSLHLFTERIEKNIRQDIIREQLKRIGQRSRWTLQMFSDFPKITIREISYLQYFSAKIPFTIVAFSVTVVAFSVLWSVLPVVAIVLMLLVDAIVVGDFYITYSMYRLEGKKVDSITLSDRQNDCADKIYKDLIEKERFDVLAILFEYTNIFLWGTKDNGEEWQIVYELFLLWQQKKMQNEHLCDLLQALAKRSKEDLIISKDRSSSEDAFKKQCFTKEDKKIYQAFSKLLSLGT